jgi:hypothetical protein
VADMAAEATVAAATAVDMVAVTATIIELAQ